MTGTASVQASDNAHTPRSQSSPYWLIIPLMLAYVIGIHIGQISAITSPWPENMQALVLNIPLNWRIPGRVGMVLILALMTLRLSGHSLFHSPARFPSALREIFGNMAARHYRAAFGVGLFVLPLILIAGAQGFAIVLAYALVVVAGALLVNLGLIGRFILACFWLTIGVVNADALASARLDMERECQPGAQILLKTGGAHDCSSVQPLSLYSMLLIRHQGGAVLVPASELELWSLEDAAGARAAAAFD